MSHRYEKLLTPLVLPNGQVLRNRMVQPKCAPDQNQGPETWPTDQFIHFHRDSARRGNSLVVVCDADRPFVRTLPETHDFAHSFHFDLSNPATNNYLCQLSDDVHFYGSKVVVQMSTSFPNGVTLGGKNPDFSDMGNGRMPMPPATAATKEQMQEAIDAFVKQCLRYKDWGFDGVSTGVTGLDRETDIRTDEYGGSTENRCRFTLELCEAVKKACGKEFIIHIMMMGEAPKGGGMTIMKEGYYLEDTITFAKLAEGVVDLITVRENGAPKSHPTGYTFSEREHDCIGYCKAMKEAGVKIPLAVAGGFQDPGEMEDILESGVCDLISIGRGQFTDADYYTKVLEERGEDIRPCLRCNRCHGIRKGPWHSVCAVNPEFNMETKIQRMIKPAERVKKVAIIGGGPAGMQAAITAADRGHKVVLFEKTDYLGGQLYHADHFSFKWPFRNYRLWLIREMEKKGVEVRLNCAPTAEDLKAEGYDAVLAATGAKAKVPNIEGMHNADGSAAIRTCHDVIGKESELGKHVIMVGCSETGVETACYLAQNGHDVTCLTRQDRLAKDASPLHSITIAYIAVDEEGYGGMEPFWHKFKNLKGITKATTTKVTAKTVTYVDENGVEHTIEGDDVIVCGGVEPCVDAALQYATVAPEFYLIGDVAGAGNIRSSIHRAFGAASQL
ncbi:MAG: FAD-dependent oxidoreductase [Ruminococcaceae bacterium]|nr:FAD-dependent oxidoreductase [Oscillospiraceae bacterium]